MLLQVITDPLTGRSKGYGFVRFGNEAERDRSLTEMSGHIINSRPIRVSVATAKKSQSSAAVCVQIPVSCDGHTPERAGGLGGAVASAWAQRTGKGALCLCAPHFEGPEFVMAQGQTCGRVKSMVDVRDGSSLFLCWALRDPAWCVLHEGGANAQLHPHTLTPATPRFSPAQCSSLPVLESLCRALRDPTWCVLLAGGANVQPHPSKYNPSNTTPIIVGLSSFLWSQCRVSGTCVGH